MFFLIGRTKNVVLNQNFLRETIFIAFKQSS